MRLYYVKACSHGAITTSIHLSQLMGYVGFSVIVEITLCKHLH